MNKVFKTTKIVAAFTVYNTLLTKYPLRTKMVTAGCITALSDCICQKLMARNDPKAQEKPYNYRRTLLMTGLSVFYGTPICHFWFGTVVKIANVFTKNKKALPFVTTAIDQLFFSAPSLAAFLYIIELIDKRDSQRAKENVKEKLWPGLLANWQLWPAAQLINFGLVPASYRVLFSNLVGFFWGIYMSYLQFNSTTQPQLQVQQQDRAKSKLLLA